MQLIIRPADLPQDYPAIAAVLEAESPGWGESAEELAYADATRDQQYHHATFVAEETSGNKSLMVGVAFVGHDLLAHREGKFEINLVVLPDWQGRGVGKALYAALLEHLAPMTPQELVTMIGHDEPRPRRFLTERGFVEGWRRVDWQLTIPTFDFTPYAGLEERLRAQGITIKRYTELAADPTCLVKWYELDWALWQSIPYGQAVAKRSFEQFVAGEVNHPNFLPDACFFALAGDELIGYSNLTTHEQGFNTEMTGVLPTYRGRGVATLLKLYGIGYAQAQGSGRLDTENDAVNHAMIALNQKLGFVQTGARLRFVKQMA